MANSPVVWRRVVEMQEIKLPTPSEIDKESSAWAAQQGSTSVLPYKYAVCLAYGRPPQDTGLTTYTAKYGGIRVGSQVLIHKHRQVCHTHKTSTDTQEQHSEQQKVHRAGQRQHQLEHKHGPVHRQGRYCDAVVGCRLHGVPWCALLV